MADLRFYQGLGPITITEVAALSGAAISDSAMGAMTLSDVAPLEAAEAGKLSYAESPKALNAHAAGALDGVFLIVPPDLAGVAGAMGALILTHRAPRQAFSRIGSHLFSLRGFDGTERRHPEADCHPSARIAPGAVIAAGASIGEGVSIGPNAAIGPGCRIGRFTSIGANVSISCADIGEHCNILAGAVIGEAGFGVAVSGGSVIDVPHLGTVRLGDNVTVGANSAIDRGVFGETRIGDGCKIDNLCHIAHNVSLDAACLMPAFAGVSGSTRIGRGVMFGGRVGVSDHVVIGDGARIGANSAVMADVPAGETYAGAPAQPIRQHMREIAEIRRMVRARAKARTGE
ncbi:UDP-3-O-(3-hydroxymyristoyl)glucosamine N-acyltransferase [Maricaulis salignorans]|uniref:UDP-3-O-[3-hydroxymyristoyl] glucosamine N-acyltransferase n=1 Tax=Maricaulis salignorans TaxID=144026 RepID=A0A1G9VAW5_9PROT|nr:UDP-3-O-(3-hydroxymyristoyl)glucosamine N-acyltransferase [Maricaulis salignorans]SDM69005.1 UDP-3-O-[3-hydroxymyristoyl] glucosamine N-acyltransferase [Maricaulis salignorans]